MRSADELASRADSLLRADVESNLLATVLELARRSPKPANMFGLVQGAAGEVVGAALRLPPRRMLTTGMADEAASTLTRAWMAADPDLPGIAGPSSVARAGARVWEQSTGGRSEVVMAEALHTVERIIDPTRPANGALRPATGSDRSLLIEWIDDFQREAGVDGNPADMVDRRELHVWDDEGPVSVVGRLPAVAGVVRIGPVYTPPQHRGRGYGSSAVAAVSRGALAAGARQCMLFTDLANPTSNKIYAALGYRRVGDWEELAFERR